MKTLLMLVMTLSLWSEPWKMNFHNPTINESSFSTSSGGTAQTNTIYIQAKEIHYVQNQSLDAKTDLFIRFKGYFLKADSLHYCLSTQEGVLYNATVNYGSWYIQAHKAILNNNGITLSQATITTSATAPDDWKIHMKTVILTPDYLLRSSPMITRVCGFPICILPQLSLNLKTIKHSPFRYKIAWETGQGPHIRLGTQLYATEDFSSYCNLFYQYPKGIGAQCTTNYQTSKTFFSTQNSYSYRTYYNANDPKTLQPFARFKGTYTHQGNINALIEYDYLSDFNFTQYFPTTNFSHTPAKPTQISLTQQKDNYYGAFLCKGKLNPWESMNQYLPSLTLNIRPFTNFINMDNSISLSNNYYSYAHSLHPFMNNFHARRVALSPKISKCFPFGPLIFTPSSQLRFIYYQSQEPLVCLDNQLHLRSSWINQSSTTKHTLSPFVTYTYITKPTISPNQHPIFTINDGWNTLNQCNIGMDNHWRFNSYQINTHLTLTGLFDQTTYQKKFPIITGSYTCISQKTRYHCEAQYNLDTNALNTILLSGGWTLSPKTALSCDLFYRGSYGFRKSDPDQYILDVSHTLESLENSTLSLNQKNLILRLQTNINPTSQLKLENHTGWDSREGYYTENMLCMETILSNSWKCGFDYTHTIRADKVNFFIKLIQK